MRQVSEKAMPVLLKVRAAGGLIKYLEKMRVGIELEDAETRVPVLGLRIFSL